MATIASSGCRIASAAKRSSAARHAYAVDAGATPKASFSRRRRLFGSGCRHGLEHLADDIVAGDLLHPDSGLSISRCASAGTATAFTSSGVTKSRPESAALQRASLSTARLPRGLAPTAVELLVRVAETSSTM